jgi:hypothetical protein
MFATTITFEIELDLKRTREKDLHISKNLKNWLRGEWMESLEFMSSIITFKINDLCSCDFFLMELCS